MSQYLLFRLFGTIAAWGDTAVGEYRPTWAWPGRSALIGLLAAARGIRRDEVEELDRMGRSYGFAVAIHNSGLLLRDYHTAQVPGAAAKRRWWSRRDELKETDLNTILSSRDYRTDGAWTVAVWERTSEPAIPLDHLANSLERPAFALYLGRKACPPSLPLCPHIVEAATLRDAFACSRFPDAQVAGLSFEFQPDTRVAWEKHDRQPTGFGQATQTIRRDDPANRVNWQFRERLEFTSYMGKEDS